MIITVGSGHSGVGEYLERGQKADRFYDRDDLDERMIIKGDLTRLQAIIDCIDEEKENRYFHYALAFKENHVSKENLNEICLEFEQFIKHGYGDEELEFYAEAHIPKIKSYVDANDNEVERMPHIHVVIPKLNLSNGNRYDPLIKSQIKYLDAFQESINAKYGLESPKDNLRTEFTNASEIISRYKSGIFNGHNREEKSQILEIIINKNPSNQIELYQELRSAGYKVKMRNGTKAEQSYLNVTLPGEIKGINLKDNVFRNSFLNLEQTEKINEIKSTVAKHYRDANGPTIASDKAQHNLKEWQDWKALEVRYLQDLNKSEARNYRKFNFDEKVKFLNIKHQQTLNKLQIQGVEISEVITTNQREFNNVIRKIGRNSEHLESNLNRITITDPERTRAKFRELSVGSNTREHRANFELSNSDSASTKRSVIEEVSETANREIMSEKHELSLGELNKLIKADALLELAEKTHGINPELYFISVDMNGNDRIKCGKRNLNMVDFVTKELNLPFKEALPYLQNVYQMQNNITREKPVLRDKKYLQDEYKEWFKNYKLDKTKAINETKANFIIQRKNILQKYNDSITAIKNNKALDKTKRSFEISLAKSQKIFDIDALQKARNAESTLIREKYNTDMQSAYRIFLTEQAKKGNDEALEELRRLRIKFNDKTIKNTISYVERYQEFKLNISHDIDKDGVINYKLNNKIILRDEGKRLDIRNSQSENLKLSLNLAMAKFGNKLTLDGDEKFRQKVVETALKSNLKVEFLDEYSKKYHAQLKEELSNGAKVINQSNDKFISELPDRCQYISTRNVEINNEKGLVKSVNLHTVKNQITQQNIEITNTSLDYLLSKNQLDTGQLFDTKKTDDGVKLNLTKESKLRFEIKQQVLSNRKANHEIYIKEKYNITSPLQKVEGVFIKLDKSKFGKEFGVVKTQDGYVRLTNPDVLSDIKQQNITNGAKIIVTIVKEDEVTKMREVSKLKINKANNVINLDELQLIADLQLTKQSGKKASKEGIGEVTDIRAFTATNSTKIFRTVIKTSDGELKAFYLQDKKGLKAGSFAYIRQTAFNKVDVVNLTEQKNQQLIKAKERLGSENIAHIEFGKLSKLGIRDIRGKDVFFAEYKSVEDGKPKSITKYGEAVKKQIYDNNIKAGDLISLTKSNELEPYKDTQQIIVVSQLDLNINAEIDKQLTALYQVSKEQEDAKIEVDEQQETDIEKLESPDESLENDDDNNSNDMELD